MIKLNAVLALFVCLMIFSCKTEENSPLTPLYDDGVTFVLEYDETANCNCTEGPEISFTQVVEESRCPELVTCVWEGQVIVNLMINSVDVELGISPSSDVHSIDTIGNWSVELLEVRPYPSTPDDLPNHEDYELDLVVREL